MTDEVQIERDYLPTDNELLQIIETECMLLATIADISEAEYRTYEDEIKDINVVKMNAYKVLLRHKRNY